MYKINLLLRGLNFIAALALILLPLQSVQGQAAPTITATGEVTQSDDQSFSLPLTLTFSPAGGDVSGTVYDQRDYTNSDGSICTLLVRWNWIGSFEGGDGGVAGGPLDGTLEGEGCTDGFPTFNYSGSWSGNFYADGTGSGVYDATIEAQGQTASGQFIWSVTFSPAEFEAGLQPAVEITTDYIHVTYGIYVVNSFPDSPFGQQSWTPHELELLNDVLKNLPRDMLDRLKLKRFIRDQYDVDKSGNSDSSTFGMYVACEKQWDPDCTNPSGTIHVFDHASSPYDFTDSDTQFKATILHEMTHSMARYKDEYSIYSNPASSPLLKGYMEATRSAQLAGNSVQNGWVLYGARGWVYYGSQGNIPPTTYGQKSPSEDLCESVMMYVYDPQVLQFHSPQRYEFIRDHIFGGVEYESATQKTP